MTKTVLLSWHLRVATTAQGLRAGWLRDVSCHTAKLCETSSAKHRSEVGGSHLGAVECWECWAEPTE